jgi:hypothetical protein
MGVIRDWARLLRRTPIHPQWLLGQRQVPASIENASGLVLDIGAADQWIISHLPAMSFVLNRFPRAADAQIGSGLK